METSDKIELVKMAIIRDSNERINLLLKRCESEIEKLFLINAYCFFLKGSYNLYSVDLICDLAKTTFDPITREGTVLSPFDFVDDFGNPTQVTGFKVTGGNFSYKFLPQYVIETNDCEYRLDIAVIHDFEFITGRKKGQTTSKKYGIECDGFMFHSTKEQQSNDNRRTRKLMELGWTILRYSGQEIYKMKGYKDFQTVLMTLDSITTKG